MRCRSAEKGTEVMQEGQGERRGYEVRDVNLRFLTAVVIGFFLLLLAGMSVSLWFQNTMLERQQATDTPASPLANTLPALPPEPRLQVTPGVDLRIVRAEEDEVLKNYAWVDAKTGIEIGRAHV